MSTTAIQPRRRHPQEAQIDREKRNLLIARTAIPLLSAFVTGMGFLVLDDMVDGRPIALCLAGGLLGGIIGWLLRRRVITE